MNQPLPFSFLRRMQEQLPEDEFRPFTEELGKPPLTSVRLNPRKPGWNDGEYETVPWCEHGRYFTEKPVFTLDPLFHAGAYYPQEASSMVLWHILETIAAESGRDLNILDLCGAPGGKATLIASFLDGEGVLVTNEVVRSRARILRENIIKWGAPNVVVSQSDPSVFSTLPGLFDVMVVDAPCSGEGMFRKGDTARREWSEENAAHCAWRQRRILEDAWEALNKGGWLVYSTCTFNPAENEENLEWLIREHGAEVITPEVPDEWGIEKIPAGGGSALAFFPHKVKGEGFFIALLRKNEKAQSSKFPKMPKNRAKVPEEARRLTDLPDRFSFLEENGQWTAFPREHERMLLLLQKQLNILQYGILLGTMGRKEMVPDHALIMSWIYNNYFPVFEMSKNEALHYQKGEVPAVPSGMPGGFIVVTFRKIPLGFLKNVGPRFNNLYPKEWRIRMEI
ncbi:MAG: RNA methyltransferase [Marinilabilia sp.]